jgi:hypothetical protein
MASGEVKKSSPPPRKSVNNPLPQLRVYLGGPVVFLRCVGKKPVGAWGRLTTADMTPPYLASLKDHNIGVALGEASGGLCAIDFDDENFIVPFLATNPAFTETFRTHGARGCTFWIRLSGNCPRSFKLKSESGEAVGEFRSNGNQSIAWGTHPVTKKSYQWVVRKRVIEIALDSIHWPEGIIAPVGQTNLSLKGELPKGDVSKGADSEGSPPYNCLEVECVCPGVGAPACDSEIDRAVEFGERSTQQNNEASFRACLALIQFRGGDDLSDLPPADRRHFAERWYQHLKSKGRTTKPKTHYYNDIFNSIKNAKRKDTMSEKNPIPLAWELAQSKPPPPEASPFDGDETMQRLIALCHQLHVICDGGEWFLSRNKVGELMGLDATATRNLSENFNVLVGCGVLEIVTPSDKAKRQATTYRYVAQDQPHSAAKEGESV